jgi:hypothetical protein
MGICLVLRTNLSFTGKLIFFPKKRSQDYQFVFIRGFEELNIRVEDGFWLDRILFWMDSFRDGSLHATVKKIQ